MVVQKGDGSNFNPDIKVIETTDPGHADTFNPLFKLLIDNDTFLNLTKADLSFVIAELAKKTTPAEVDARVQAVIGTAPAALDALDELANALNNDPNFATTIIELLATKVDKVAGKQLSTEDYTTAEKAKLAAVEPNANKYVHPPTHPATMIEQNPTHRFVSDGEKASWNGKLDANANAVSASKLQTGRTIALSGDVTGSAVFDGSSNVTITATVADDSHAHIIGNIDGLQEALDAKETPGGAQAKSNAAEANAINFVKSNGLGQGLSNRATNNSNTATLTGMYYAPPDDPNKPVGVNDGALFVLAYNDSWVNQIYMDWRTNKTYRRICTNGTWSAWQELETTTGAQTKANQAETNAKTYADGKFATKNEISNAGYGDMLKSVYDPNGDGKVNSAVNADVVPWTGITDKPGTFPPSTHNHQSIAFIDSRDVNFNPFSFTGVSIHLKSNGADGLFDGGIYHGVMHLTQWGEASGGRPHQLAFTDNGNIYFRQHDGATWTAWRKLVFEDATNTYNMKVTHADTALNATKLDGLAISNVQYVQSHRDFTHGTLIATNIDYSGWAGESFLLEIVGNSYGALIPFDIKMQGYIYADTIINAAGISNGTNITGLVAFNYNGFLHFWFPSQGYWQGFNVFVQGTSAPGVNRNRVQSISDAVKPTNITKEVAIPIYQSFHAGNDGSGSGLDADLLDGYHVGSSGQANTVVTRDGNGYILNTWFNSNRPSENTPAAQYIYDTGDGYMRKKDLANVRAEIGGGNIYDQSADMGITKLMRWKNYGDGHVIFDASNGTSPNGVGVDNANPQIGWSRSYPTLMGWNGSNTYGVRVDSARVADSAGNADTLDGKHAAATPITAEKNDIIGMINELFTSASNGKTAVANAITGKGVSASGNDAFATLADKIGQISTGKKWASGIIKSSTSILPFTGPGGYVESFCFVEVNGLTFTPSLIIVSDTKNYTDLSVYSTQFPEDRKIRMTILDGSTAVHYKFRQFQLTNSAYVNATGFLLPASDYYHHMGADFIWMAIE